MESRNPATAVIACGSGTEVLQQIGLALTPGVAIADSATEAFDAV